MNGTMRTRVNTGAIDTDLSLLRAFGLGAISEWRSVYTGGHNVLLEGPEASTQAVLRLLEPRLCEPVAWKQPHAPFALPSGECGALVVQDIGALNSEEQAQLLAWLDDPSRRTQVVTTAATPLFPLVVRGLFNATLYYRLNVMLLQFDSMDHVEPDTHDAEANAVGLPSTTTSALQFA
jgi:hypothetical protein